jgi:hypothetical protein
MINRKLKAALSLVLALIVMCSACVVPVFALDDVSEGGLTQNVAILKTVSNIVEKIKAKGGTLDDKYYIAYWQQANEWRIDITVISLPFDTMVLTDGVLSDYGSYTPEIWGMFMKTDSNSWNDDAYTISISASTSTSFMHFCPTFYVNDNSPDYAWHIIDTNVDIINNGEKLEYSSNKPYKASITYDDDSKNFLFNFEPKNDNDVYNVNIAVSNQSEWDYPNSDGWYYLPMDTSGDFTKENPLHGSIPLNVMRDGIMRYNSNKDIENTGKLYFFLIAAKGKGDEALYKDRFCAASYEYSLVDTVDSHKKEPFDEKKDYENFPPLSDYIDTDFPDIRDYVNFDMFQDLDGISDFLKAVVEFLWNAFTGFFRWLWAALKFIFFNFIGLFKWLGECLWIIIKNIGIALYNLVVDLKKLVTYLFVPNSKDLNVAIESKFPAYAKLRKAFQQGKQSSSNSVTFTLFGKNFDFNMNSAPNELKSALFNASTIAMYAICIYATIKALFRCFGIQLHESSESEGE